MLILALSPIPLYDCYVKFTCMKNEKVVYLLSEFMIAFMSFRVFFLVRTMLNYSDYMDAFSKKLCKSYGFNTGVRFTIKCLLMTKPEQTVMYMFFGTVLISAYLIRIFEMPLFRSSGQPIFDSY